MNKLAEDWRSRSATLRAAVENGLPLDGDTAAEMNAIAACLDRCAAELDGNVVIRQEDYDTVMGMIKEGA